MTGCDTTSALCRQGLVKHNPELQTLDEVLLDSFFHARHSGFSWRGNPVGLVWCHQHDAVPKHTHTPLLHEAVATCPIQLGALTPTSLAAREHSWHVYHQVHSWIGNDPLPSDLGWYLVNGQLCPVLSRLTPAPDALLNLISWNCKFGCERGYGCRRASCVLWYADGDVLLVFCTTR